MSKPYPSEFRRGALDLVASGRAVVEVAASLGVSRGVLCRWRSRELVDTGAEPGRTGEDAEELAKANKRIRELEEAVAVRREAAAAVEAVVPPKGRYALVAARGSRDRPSARASEGLLD